jgi:hypothetical protein
MMTRSDAILPTWDISEPKPRNIALLALAHVAVFVLVVLGAAAILPPKLVMLLRIVLDAPFK